MLKENIFDDRDEKICIIAGKDRSYLEKQRGILRERCCKKSLQGNDGGKKNRAWWSQLDATKRLYEEISIVRKGWKQSGIFQC